MARAEPLVRIHRHGGADPPDVSTEWSAARGRRAGSASAAVFSALGVQAAHGRTFTQDEDLEGSDAVIILSHEFWQSRLGGRSDVVGSTIDADGRKRTVVGIMPPQFTIEGVRADFYITYGWTTERLRAAIGRGVSHAIARLRDGVTLQQAADEMATIAAQREKENVAAQCRDVR